MNNNFKNKKKRKKYFKNKRCFFKDNNIVWIDYKDYDLLKRFINRHGKINSAKATGTKTKTQRQLSIAIKRARHIGILPFTADPFANNEFKKRVDADNPTTTSNPTSANHSE